MRAIKSFDTILFVSSCLQISDIPVTKKAELLITMRAIKSLDYILFCLQMCSWRLIVNRKKWLNRKLALNFRVLFMPCVLMKIHCEQTDFGYLSVSRQTLTNVTFNRHLVASCSKLRSSNDYRQGEDVFKSTIFRTRVQSGMGELEMDSRPFPAPLPHGIPVPFPPPPVSRLRTTW